MLAFHAESVGKRSAISALYVEKKNEIDSTRTGWKARAFGVMATGLWSFQTPCDVLRNLA
jgi:hypothetical protein